MLNTLRSYARPCLGAGVAVGLLTGLLVSPVGAAQAASARDLVGSWMTRLEQRAAELESAPRVKATRVGAGMVLKKGDGGIVDVVVPGPVQPTVQAGESQPSPAAPEPAVALVAEMPANGADGTMAIEPGPPPPVLTLPMRARSADRVGRLASRLIELGYLAPEQWTDSFDDNVEAAVRAFQVAEGLMPDGKVGEVTRQALDRTPAQAAALMRNAVTALRTFQPSVPDTVVLVNLPSQTVSYIERGKLMFTMRAVVGRPTRQTPLLQDRVTSVTVNPTWTVPPTVLVEDKLPVLRKKGNTGIKDAIVYLDGVEVVPEQVNWWSVTPERIKIVQRPGDDNALGRFRFNLTNGEGIFLHGTNDPKLFDRDLRAASSGCVRLADARQMAETLLRAKVDAGAIDRQLESGQTKTIALPKAVPVHFVYWTATVEPTGTVRVHPGIYDEPPSAAPAGTPVGAAPSSKRVEPKTVRSVPAAGTSQSADVLGRAFTKAAM
ncbi:MAG TPA: L,D-transpeptidase family protein [Azospirillum sp.]|nr:L,D-transpeptidase family protein [Azospirillum sp.]